MPWKKGKLENNPQKVPDIIIFFKRLQKIFQQMNVKYLWNSKQSLFAVTKPELLFIVDAKKKKTKNSVALMRYQNFQ